MPIPTHEDAMLPVLLLLRDEGPQHRRTLADRMADRFALSEDERATLIPSGKAPVIRSRIGWALAYLKQAALVCTPRRGWYEITELGRKALDARPERIDNAYLANYVGFQEFRERSRVVGPTPIALKPGPPIVEPVVPPDEALRAAYAGLRAAVESELLDSAKRVPPAFFEQLVVDLLVRMGYGGSREGAARAVGRSGDGGIDGVIDEDRLGLDVIYVQAKRWEGAVGRPEVQKFAGALQGQRARKGILITTSSFTRDAVAYADRIDTRIVLVDGVRLATLMFDHDVGVTARDAYVVKTVDGDYFEDA